MARGRLYDAEPDRTLPPEKPLDPSVEPATCPPADMPVRLTRNKLRTKLRAAGIRPDLVRSSGGQVSLVILDGDRLEVEL